MRSRYQPLMLELPPYRLPNLRNLALGLWERARIFLTRVGTIIFSLMVLLWFLSSYPAPPAGATGPAIEYSSPGGSARRCSTCSRRSASTGRSRSRWCRAGRARGRGRRARHGLRAVGQRRRGGQALAPVIAAGWSLATAYSLLAWFVFAPQCLSTLAVVRRETNSWRYPLLMAAYLFALAYVASFVTYRVALALGGGMMTILLALQDGAVALVVAACLAYAVWTLLPAGLRRRAAQALLALPGWPAPLAARLRGAVRKPAGCGGCAACGSGPGAAPRRHEPGRRCGRSSSTARRGRLNGAAGGFHVAGRGTGAAALGSRAGQSRRRRGHRVVAQPHRQREADRLLDAWHAPHRHRAERAQPLDDLLHQDVGRRRAGGQADAALALEPLGSRSSGRSTMWAAVPSRSASSRSRLLLELVGLPTTITHVDLRAEHLHRVLAVLRGVADVLLLGLAHGGKARLHRGEDLGRVVDRQRRLRHHGEAPGPRHLRARHVGHVLDEEDALAELAHRALDLGMALVADHDELVAFARQLGDLDVHLGDQRAGGVEDAEAALRPPPGAPPG